MYNKDLSESVRLRLSSKDMDFLRSLSKQRNSSISEVIRSIIGEYRRSLESVTLLTEAIQMLREKEREAVHGDTETNINYKL